MINYLVKYRAVVVATVLVLVVTGVLAYLGFLLIDPTAVVENVVLFSFWIGLVAIVLYHIDQLEHRWKVLGKIGFVIFGFILIISVSARMDIADNPVTLILFAFWGLYVSYLIAPHFIWKYRLLIVAVYGPTCIYFIYNCYFNSNYISSNDQVLASFLLPIPFFILIWLYEQWKWFQSLKADKAQAELALLKSQINPHFFFNTLNNLYSLAVNQSDQTPIVILKLSEMMRYTIYEGKKDQVSLEAELNNVQNFIDLHKIRHKNKIDITFDRELDAGYQVSPLLFINLVENAFKHGAERMTEGAFIHLSVSANERQIVFSIRNNFDPKERLPTKGIGLGNLRKRLELLYPNTHSFTIGEQGNQYFCELKLRNNTKKNKQ